MASPIVISLLLLINAVSISFAATMGVRAYLGCALVKNQTHCFGGYTGTDSESSSTYINPSADHFYLDMSAFNFADTSNAMSNWTIAKDSVTLESTGFVQAASMNNQSKLLLYGGSSPTGSDLLNPFMTFDPSNGDWFSIYTFGNYTRFGSIVSLDSSQKVWTWGGAFNATWNVTSYAYEFDFTKLQWTQISGDTSNSYTRYQHSATLVTSTNTIYIIGGMNRNLAPGGVDFGADMLEIRTFNTVASSWGTIRANVSNGQNITPRNFHTTTYIPNTSIFLIYGGDASDTINTAILVDYAYLYDYNANAYTPLNFAVGEGAGARTGHVAIQYNSYVMIMFGVNSQHELLQDLHVLNMTNATSPTWLGAPVVDTPTTISHASGLSPGAIAGIVVAAIVASIVITAALIFILNRKRKQRKEFELETTDPRRNSLIESMIIIDKQHGYYNTTSQSVASEGYSKAEMVGAPQTVVSTGTATVVNDQSVYSASPISPTFYETTKPFFADEGSHRVKPDGDC